MFDLNYAIPNFGYFLCLESIWKVYGKSFPDKFQTLSRYCPDIFRYSPEENKTEVGFGMRPFPEFGLGK